MKTYRYWAKATEPVQTNNYQWRISIFGGSNVSVEDALANAQERAKAAADAINRGVPPQRYAYGDRPLREQIVKEIHKDGERVAVLTRNAYGSLVLNTANVMFADIDYKPSEATSGLQAVLGMLFGQKKQSNPDQEIMDRIAKLTNRIPGLGVRLYRTAKGFRSLVTSTTFAPTSRDSVQLLKDFGSDPLYITLCQTQECFRARLTPKHWRCGVSRPPTQFPWADANAELAFQQWDDSYQSKIEAYSTCALIGEIGSTQIHPDVEPIMRIHDEVACANNGPLA